MDRFCLCCKNKLPNFITKINGVDDFDLPVQNALVWNCHLSDNNYLEGYICFDCLAQMQHIVYNVDVINFEKREKQVRIMKEA